MNEPSKADSPKRKRRPIQYSLSVLFCVTALVAIWAWGIKNLFGILDSDLDGWIIGSALITISTIAGICVFMRAAVRHHQRMKRPTKQDSGDGVG